MNVEDRESITEATYQLRLDLMSHIGLIAPWQDKEIVELVPRRKCNKSPNIVPTINRISGGRLTVPDSLSERVLAENPSGG